MNFKNLVPSLFVFILLVNCSSSSDDAVTQPDPDPAPTGLTYDDDIKSIIAGNCLNCHGNPTDQGAPVSYVTYNQVKTDVNKIISRINNSSNPMPPAGLINADLRAKIQQWKDDGLLE